MLQLFITICAFLVILTFLVLVHELGHFLAARIYKVKVEEFGLGLPPRAKKLFIWKKTVFSLNWIPLGGFVKLFGEHIHSKEILHTPHAFPAASRAARFWIIIGGVMMNWLVAWIILTFVFMVGFHPLAILPEQATSIKSFILPTVSHAQDIGVLVPKKQSYSGLYIKQVLPHKLGNHIGLLPGDIITHIEDKEVTNVMTLREILTSIKEQFNITYMHNEISHTKHIASKEVIRYIAEGRSLQLGIVLEPNMTIQKIQFDILKAPFFAAGEVYRQTLMSFIMAKQTFGKLFTTLHVPDEIMGPVGIASVTGTVVQQGFITTCIFVAIISLSLAVMNILPLPALDGGRLVFLLLEILTRKRTSLKIENMIHTLGFIFLIGLIIIITGNDIARIAAT